MTWWADWLGWGEFNSWEVYWGAGNETAVLLVLALLVPATLWWFWSSLNRVTLAWKKYLLFGLRVLTVILLLLVLLQPRLEFKNVQPIPNSIAVLLDDSKSLSIKTFPSEKPRMDLVREALENNAETFNRLKEKYRVDFYFASDHLAPVAQADAVNSYQPRGPYTDFTLSLKELKERYHGKSLQGVMLFSDGGDLIHQGGKMGAGLSEVLSHLDGPVHTFQAGSNERFKDLAIERFDVSDFGFIHQPLTIKVTLRASGIGKKNVPLVLRENEKILVTRIVELNDEETHYEAELDFTPTETGKRIYTLTVPVFAGESVETNNRKFFQVSVVRDRLRVLHLNGRPSWDSRFLREVLINNPKVDLLSFFILRTLSDDVQAPTAELSLIPFPSNLLFTDYLSSFDLVVFQNFKYVPFLDKKYLSNIKDYVKGGGAFLMVGGELSFQAGGYLNSPVEDILPVRMDRTVKQIQNEEFVPEISPELIHHPILQLEKRDGDNLNAWKQLPSLFGLNAGLTPAPGAQVLASVSKLTGKPQPLLATTRAGEGRSMIIASDTIWNWNFQRVGQGGSGRQYQKFWENVIDWMTGAPEMLPLHLETDKEKYLEGEKVLLSFTALGEDYNPIPDAELKLTLDVFPNRDQKIEKVLTADKDGRGTFEFQPAGEGFYTVHLSVDQGDLNLANQIKFSVVSPTAEFDKPLVNSDLLQKISDVTGGSFQELGRGTPIADLRFPNPEIEIKTRSRSLSLWDNWWSYGLILTLLLAEWWIRRKSGLS